MKSLLILSLILALSLATPPSVKFQGNISTLAAGQMGMYEIGELSWWTDRTGGPEWFVFNKSSGYLNQILPNNNTCNHTGQQFFMNSQNEFFCFNTACEGCPNVTINQVDPVTLAVLNSYTYNGPNYKSFSFNNDYIIFSNKQAGGKNVTIDLWDTTTASLVSGCPFINQMTDERSGFIEMLPYPEEDFLLYTSLNQTLTDYGTNMVNYSCSTGKSKMATLKNNQYPNTAYAFNGSTLVGVFEFQSNDVTIQGVQFNATGDAVIGKQVYYNGAGVWWGGQINDTHFAVVYLGGEDGTETGVGIFTFDNSMIPVRTSFFGMGGGDYIINFAWALGGSNNIAMLGNGLWVIDPFNSQYTYASSPSMPFYLANGSYVVYDSFAYWIYVPGQPYWPSQQLPLTATLRNPTQPDYQWFFYTPEMYIENNETPPYPNCILVVFQSSISSITVNTFKTCPCVNSDESFATNLQSVTPLGNGQFNVTYQCLLDNLYVVNNTNLIANWTVPNADNELSTITTIYPNWANHTIQSFLPAEPSGIYVVQVSDMKSQNIVYTYNTTNDQYSTYARVSDYHVLYWKHDPFEGTELIVYDLSQLKIVQTTRIAMTLNRDSTVAPLGVNVNGNPIVSAFAVVDMNDNGYVFSADGEQLTVFTQPNFENYAMYMNNNTFAFSFTDPDRETQTYLIYEVTNFGISDFEIGS